MTFDTWYELYSDPSETKEQAAQRYADEQGYEDPAEKQGFLDSLPSPSDSYGLGGSGNLNQKLFGDWTPSAPETDDYNDDPDGLDQFVAGIDDAQASAGSAIAGPLSGFLSDYVSEDLGAYTKEYGEDLRDRNLEESAQVAQPKSAEEMIAEDPDSWYKYLPDDTPTGHQILRSTPTSLAAAGIALPAALAGGKIAGAVGLAALGKAAVAGVTGMAVGNAASSLQVAGESYERAKNDPLIRQELGIDPDKDFKDLSSEDQQTMDRFATDLSQNAFGHRVYTSGAVEMISYIPYGKALARFVADTGLGTASEVWDRSLFTEDATKTLVEYGMPEDKALEFQKKLLDRGPGLWETFWPALVQEAATGGAFTGVETIVTDPRVNSFATSTKFQLEEIKKAEEDAIKAQEKENVLLEKQFKEDQKASDAGFTSANDAEIATGAMDVANKYNASVLKEEKIEAERSAFEDEQFRKIAEEKTKEINQAEEDRIKAEDQAEKDLKESLEEKKTKKIQDKVEKRKTKDVVKKKNIDDTNFQLENSPLIKTKKQLENSPENKEIKRILNLDGVLRTPEDNVELNRYRLKYDLKGLSEDKLLGLDTIEKPPQSQEKIEAEKAKLKKKVLAGEKKKNKNPDFNTTRFAKNFELAKTTLAGKFKQIIGSAFTKNRKQEEGDVTFSKGIINEIAKGMAKRHKKFAGKFNVVDSSDITMLAKKFEGRMIEGKDGTAVEATLEENEKRVKEEMLTSRAWTLDGEIYLNADGIRGKTNKDIVQQIVQLGLFHEPIAHLGLKGYLSKGLSKVEGDKKFDKFLDNFYKTNKKDIANWEGVSAYLDEGQDLTTIPESKKQELAEEYLANNFVEFGVRDPNIVAKLADSLTRGTLSVFGRERVTVTQAQDILAEIQQEYLGGKRNIVTGDFFDQSNWLKPKKDTNEDKERLKALNKKSEKKDLSLEKQPMWVDRTEVNRVGFTRSSTPEYALPTSRQTQRTIDKLAEDRKLEPEKPIRNKKSANRRTKEIDNLRFAKQKSRNLYTRAERKKRSYDKQTAAALKYVGGLGISISPTEFIDARAFENDDVLGLNKPLSKSDVENMQAMAMLGSVRFAKKLTPMQKKVYSLLKQTKKAFDYTKTAKARPLEKQKKPTAKLHKFVLPKKANGKSPIVFLGGGKTTANWKEQVSSVLSKAQILEAKQWYPRVKNAFIQEFGIADAPNMMLAWALANKAESPLGAMKNVLRAKENLANTINPDMRKKGGLNDEVITNILQDVEATSGSGVKLYDFVDAMLGMKTRNWTGFDPDMGAPAVVDRHTWRDRGWVDNTLITHIQKKLPNDTAATNLKADRAIPNVTPVEYEETAAWLRDITAELNLENWMGKSNWTADQIQAVGWVGVTEMLEIPAGTSESVLAETGRSVAFESFWGEDSPMRSKYEKSYNQLTQEQKAEFSYNVADKIADIALKRTGVTEKGRIKGWGFWEDKPMSPNMILNISATDQGIQNLMDTIGLLAQQEGVVAFGPKHNAPNVGIDIYDKSGKFSDPDVLDKFYRGLLKASPWNKGGFIRGASQTTVKGNPALRIILENTTAKGKRVADVQENNKKLQKQRAKELSSTINELEKTLGLDVTYESFQAKMFETYNNWKNPENGYIQRINQNFRPKVSRRIQDSDATTVESTVRKQFDDFGIRYAKKTINGQNGTTSQGTYKGRLDVELDGQSHFVHWSHASDLVETDPSYHGTGIGGKELENKRKFPNEFTPRTYIGLPGYSKEGGLGKNMYEIQLDPNTIYDGNRDPDGFIIKIKEELGIPKTENATDFALVKYENSIKEAGYVGYFNISAQIAALFNPTTLKFTKEIIGRSTYAPSIRFSKKQSQPTAAELEAEFRKKGVKAKPDTSIPKDRLTLGNKKKDAGGLYTRETIKGTEHIRSDADLTNRQVIRTAKILERSAGAHAIATRSWNPLKPLTDKWTTKMQPFSDMLTQHIVAQGTLPDSGKYKALRRVVKGIILKAEDAGRDLYDILQNTKQSEIIFKYFTTKDFDPNLITDIKERNAAIKAKKTIDEIGRELERRGLMKKETRESFEGAYLPRAYLSHLLGKDEFTKAVTRGGVGTDFGYLKSRKDIPKGVRKLIMGEIEDPAYLASKATTVPIKDLAILDWLDQIAMNENWVVPKTMVKFDTLGTLASLAKENKLPQSIIDSVDVKDTKGMNVSGMWLSKEAGRIGEMMSFMPDLTVGERKVLTGLITKMAKESQVALKTNETIDTKLYAQIPDQPKYGMLAGMAVRKEIADDIFAGMEITTGEISTVEKWVGDGSIVQKYGRIWKWAKVPANPPSYVRNFSSNLILMQMSGMSVTDMPSLFIDGIKDMHGGGKNKGKLYQLAKDLGLTAGGFSQAELGKIESEFKKLQTRLTKKDSPFAVMGTIKGALMNVMDATTDFYGGIDSLGKMMMINNELKKRGLEVKDLSEYNESERQSLDDAALEAEKWLFDYSNVKGSVRYLRNAPFGAPFMSFTSLVAPLMLETLITKPWKFAPYYALGFAMKEWFKNENDIDDEQLEALKLGLNEYLKEKADGLGPAPVIPLPYLDQNGRVQFLDVSYIYPWGMFSEMFGELSRGEIIGALKTFGIFGSPVNNVVSAINTGTDAFSRRKIVDENGTNAEKVADIWWYAYNLTVPSMMHGTGPGNDGHGAVKRVYDAFTGKIEKDGEAKFTMAQSVARLGGMNVTPLAVPEGRNKQMRYQYSQVLRLQRQAKREIQNMYVMQRPKDEIKEKIEYYKERIIEKAREFKERLDKSAPPMQLIKAREDFLRKQKQKALAYKNS